VLEKTDIKICLYLLDRSNGQEKVTTEEHWVQEEGWAEIKLKS